MENVSPESINNGKGDVFGFFKYVFNFDEDNTCEMTNVAQYTVMAIIPVLLILKGVKNIFPEEDETKGSLEILAESVGQILFIVAAIWFTNRAIRYFPTYSGCEYEEFNPTSFMIPFLIILSTMQTKLGSKLNILIDRVLDAWHGRSGDYASAEKKVGAAGAAGANLGGGGIRVSQPISGGGGSGMHQPSQADFRTEQLLPSNPQLTQLPHHATLGGSHDFNQMHHSQNTPLQGVQTQNMFEPMAANEGVGSMFGSSW
jgi:hypothetical protein